MTLRNTILAAGILLMTAEAAHAQDVASGKTSFNQCLACHALDHAVVGPPLGGVIGRAAGSVPGYNYSPLMKAAGETGLVWTEQAVIDYLVNPTKYLRAYIATKNRTVGSPGKMFYMMPSEEQRKNVVAYLATTKK